MLPASHNLVLARRSSTFISTHAMIAAETAIGPDYEPPDRQENPSRFSLTIARSSVDKKLDRSRGWKGFGPPVTCPADRKSSIKLRVASAMPMESSVRRRPLGAMTSAPAFILRCANGMSAVMTISPRVTRSAIQSSAASELLPTTIRSINGVRGTAMGLLLTT